MQLQEKINKLKTEVRTEKANCKRLEEEKLLNNTFIVEMKDRLKKADCDKQCYQQQVTDRLASSEYEHQKSRITFEDGSCDTILSMTEGEKLKEACEILRKAKEMKNEVQLLQKQENDQDLQKQRSEKERTMELANEEILTLSKPQKFTVEVKSVENDQILKLQDELESEKLRRQELDDRLRTATAQLEQHNRNLNGRDITFDTLGRIFTFIGV
jgi:hypothetical protein